MSTSTFWRVPTACALTAGSLALAWSGITPSRDPAPAPRDLEDAQATVTEEDVWDHLVALASPELEGRDSPSRGLEEAARYIAERFTGAGLQQVGEVVDFRQAFERRMLVPASGSRLRVEVEGEEARNLVLGEEYAPVPGASGRCEGPLAFLGFGIDSKRSSYNDLKGKEYRDHVAVILDGEPRHARLFEGLDEVTDEADLYTKLETLAERGVVGAIVVRRGPAPAERPTGVEARDPLAIGFRHTWASWVGEQNPVAPAEAPIPAVEIGMATASELLGVDLVEVAERIDKSGKTERLLFPDRQVVLASATSAGTVSIDNVVGMVRGSDPVLANEYVVVGAHYDHVGVDRRGRIGAGADDNASGTAALIELAEALAAHPSRRSVIFAAFAAEEDGLVGAYAFCDRPPVPREALVAMINLDMVGVGDEDELIAIGIKQNPDFKKVLDRARKLTDTGIRKVHTNSGASYFERSDHYAFHRIGVPVIFFHEGWPPSENPDYHTWRDTLHLVDPDKVTRTTRLALNTLWLICEDDERPDPPRG